MDVEIGDLIFIYNESEDRIKTFEVKSINKTSYRVEKNWGKQFNAFTVPIDEENKTWFNSYASALSWLLDKEYTHIKKIKRDIERQMKRLDTLKKHSRPNIKPIPSDKENSS